MMLSSSIKDIIFKNPVMVASGTYGYGNEVKDIAQVESLGGIVTKSVTAPCKTYRASEDIYMTSIQGWVMITS